MKPEWKARKNYEEEGCAPGAMNDSDQETAEDTL